MEWETDGASRNPPPYGVRAKRRAGTETRPYGVCIESARTGGRAIQDRPCRVCALCGMRNEQENRSLRDTYGIAEERHSQGGSNGHDRR